jgi:hypothetical protein
MIVLGDRHAYHVWATPDGVHCSCYAGADSSEPVCSHAIAAMLCWAEGHPYTKEHPRPEGSYAEER